mmetsp:Transcript_38830/g.53938  ORF Transcript_38830/g.53938 Transcript_38830/m.53938 type:complete len:104 (+) Transcript_38830:153-464(+)
MGSLLPGWDLDGCSHFNDNPSTKLLRLRTVSKGVAIKGGILLEGAADSLGGGAPALIGHNIDADWWRRTPHSYLNEAPKDIEGKRHTFTPLLPLSQGADGTSR